MNTKQLIKLEEKIQAINEQCRESCHDYIQNMIDIDELIFDLVTLKQKASKMNQDYDQETRAELITGEMKHRSFIDYEYICREDVKKMLKKYL
jgi:hypothetical protein